MDALGVPDGTTRFPSSSAVFPGIMAGEHDEIE
jgi:hypothetical protein